MQFSKGPYFAEQGDFTTAGVGQHQLRQRARAAAGAARRRRARVWPRAGGRVARRWRRAPAWRDRTAAQRRAVGSARRLREGQRRAALQPRRRRQRVRDHGHGLPRHVELDRPDPEARRRAAAPSGASATSTRPTAASRRATARSFEWQRTRGAAATKVVGLRPRVRPRPVLELHLLPRRSGQRRPVPASRPPRRQRRQGQSPADRDVGWQGRAEHASASSCGTTTSAASGCITPSAGSASRPSAKTTSCRPASARSRRTRRSGRRGCARLAGVRVDGYRFGVEAGRAGQQRHGVRLASEPEGRRHAGAVEGHRDLRERRARLPQQRRARRDDHGRSRDRRSGRTESRRWRAPPAPRSGLRTVRLKGLQSTVALWTLGLESELLFVGDAGTTEAGRPSRRYGVEWANYYTPQPWLIVDGDVSVSRGALHRRRPGRRPDSRRRRDGGVGRRRPSTAFETCSAASAGATSGRGRCVEDGSVRSASTSLVNLEVGYRALALGAAGAGRLQPARRAAQRRRLLLHVAPAGRAGRTGSTTCTSTRRCRAPRG